jgi:hypothetical protein
MASPSREATLVDSSPHPVTLRLGDNQPDEMVRVDDPVLAPLFFGAPDLGWEGDHRLAVYAWPRERAFLLVRLEQDNRYRGVKLLPTEHPLSPANVNAVCRWLVASDSRRGHDPTAAVAAANEAVDASASARHDEWMAEDMTPRLSHALARDLGEARTTFAVRQ